MCIWCEKILFNLANTVITGGLMIPTVLPPVSTMATKRPTLGCIVNSLWRHLAAWIAFNIGSGNGLVPDGTKPLPEPMLTYDQEGIHRMALAEEHLKMQISKTRMKIVLAKSLPHFPGSVSSTHVGNFCIFLSFPRCQAHVWWPRIPCGSQATSGYGHFLTLGLDSPQQVRSSMAVKSC